MKIKICIERHGREIDNALMLKSELEKHGDNDCEIVYYYDPGNFNWFNKSCVDILIVPHMYNTASFIRNIVRYGRPRHVVNLQYEQILSVEWNSHKKHVPVGLATLAKHMCWSDSYREFLLINGLSKANTFVALPLQLQKIFVSDAAKNREYIAKSFSIDQGKSWKLFISSFTFADIDPTRQRINEKAGGCSFEYEVSLHTKSREILLDWFGKVLLDDPNRIIIYRPHPDELNIDRVIELANNNPNFLVMREGPVSEWILASDSVSSWYSTSMIEAYFAKKRCAILRPIVVDNLKDVVLYEGANFINGYDEFKTYFSGTQPVPCLNDETVKRCYATSSELPLTITSKYIESIGNEKGINYSGIIDVRMFVISYITNFGILLFYVLLKIFPVEIFKIGGYEIAREIKAHTNQKCVAD